MRLIALNTKWKRIIAVCVATLILGTGIGLLLADFLDEMATQATLLWGVERRIGAQIRAPWVKLGQDEFEVITFSSVRPGGLCAQAGIKEGDIVAEKVTIAGLCRRFHAAPGQRVSVEVTSGGSGPPLHERPKRQVTMILP